jgi:cell fate regulator YaaT (PSP1 superfamily)
MPEVVSVTFRRGGKPYYFSANGGEYKRGSQVIAETSRGVEIGTVVRENWELPADGIPSPLKPVLRAAGEADLDQDRRNRDRETEAFKYCQARVREHGLPMRLVDAVYTFDGKRLVFYFSSETRVDFRQLVRELASYLKTRIELHQLGVRDLARMIGGYGSCGRELCCTSWLPDFTPTAIRMAKEQGLSLNPTKVSGLCGRLLCCLKYEYETYVDLRRGAPRIGRTLETERGPAHVKDVNLLRGEALLEYEDKAPEWCKYAAVVQLAAAVDTGPEIGEHGEPPAAGEEHKPRRRARRIPRTGRLPPAAPAIASAAEPTPTEPERPTEPARRGGRRRPRRRPARSAGGAQAAGPATQAPADAAPAGGAAPQPRKPSSGRRRPRHGSRHRPKPKESG